MSNFFAERYGGFGIDDETRISHRIRKGCQMCAKCHTSYIVSIDRELLPEENATAEVSGASVLTPEQDSLQTVSLRVLETLVGSSIVW